MKLPKLSPLGASFSDDLVLAPDGSSPDPKTKRQPTAFGDDIPHGRRVAVRVRLTAGADGKLVFDYGDSDPITEGQPRLALSFADVDRATLAAVNTVLGLEAGDRAAIERFEVQCAPDSWVGANASSEDEAAVAFGMARVFDVALGAMANAWPSKVGAGSCSLGAIVRLMTGDETVTEVLEGGEGATPKREGADQWAGPVRAPARAEAAWLEVSESVRTGTGGLGARNGGAGIERRYTIARDAVARVAIDRITNPPHGIDRAGPPKPAEVWIESQDGSSRRVAAWMEHRLSAGDTLIVRTAGGAGHGFPGWGVDWDPDSF